MGRRFATYSIACLVLLGAGLGAYSLLRDPASPPPTTPPEFVASAGPLVGSDTFAHLAETDPVGMFDACLTRYPQQAKGFTATLEKRERVAGLLHDRELIRATVWGEVPDSPGAPSPIQVRMIWEEGFRKDAMGNDVAGSVFPAAGRPDQLITFRPAAWVKVWQLDAKGPLARSASRFCIRDSGIYRGMLRTYDAWKKRKEAGNLRTEYLGRQRVEKLNGLECHVVRRLCPQPEADSFALDERAPTDPGIVERDGFTEVTVMIDAERWLHVGTVLKKANGDLIGEYYFRDVKLVVAEFPADTFTSKGLEMVSKK